MIYNFFDKTISGSGIKNEIMSDQQLAEELHKHYYEIQKKKSTFARKKMT